MHPASKSVDSGFDILRHARGSSRNETEQRHARAQSSRSYAASTAIKGSIVQKATS
jgi:hypothetical protein